MAGDGEHVAAALDHVRAVVDDRVDEARDRVAAVSTEPGSTSTRAR